MSKLIQVEKYLFISGGKKARLGAATREVMRFSFQNNQWENLQSLDEPNMLGNLIYIDPYLYHIGGYSRNYEGGFFSKVNEFEFPAKIKSQIINY